MKNEKNILPLSKNAAKIIVAGKGADDIGIQCGGWTIDWQGKSGKVVNGGTTILEAVKKTVSASTVVKYSADGSGADSGDVAIVVVGELPYAEMFGDRADLSLSAEDAAMVEKLRAKGVRTVVVLLSGRPMIVTPTLEKSSAKWDDEIEEKVFYTDQPIYVNGMASADLDDDGYEDDDEF